jgi:HAD superfamily hydrolase (TIGR01490 family)
MKPIAFFDVDETLLATKSMFDFLRFRRSVAEFTTASERLGSMAFAGVDRVEINRAYYRLWEGENWSELMEAGRAWYAEIRSGQRIGPPFIAATMSALRSHQAAGDLIVLMSGSFEPCLRPLADELGVDTLLCTHPQIDRAGRVTGLVRYPMIGRAKLLAVHATVRRHHTNLTACHAYGDHASDLPVLRAVGHPRVVGDDPVLLAAARGSDWPVFSASPELCSAVGT